LPSNEAVAAGRTFYRRLPRVRQKSEQAGNEYDNQIIGYDNSLHACMLVALGQLKIKL
jgi:hypothetical protein